MIGTMQRKILLALLVCLPVVTAFSSIAVPHSSSGQRSSTSPTDSSSSTEKTTIPNKHAPWRIVLDIGREPLSTMPFSWARSGGRMPLKIPCDFVRKEDGSQSLVPQSDVVSMTGPNGAVTRPVMGGSFDTVQNHQQIQFSLTFPEALERNDVSIPSGTTIQCLGRMYTKSELDQLYQAFYDARDKAWELGGKLNEMTKIEGPPKRWNEELKRWETRSKSINPLTWAQTRLAYAAAKAEQERRNEARPDPKDLSGRGSLPGIGDSIFVAKEGIAKTQSGAVIGRWSMEPMLDRPVALR